MCVSSVKNLRTVGTDTMDLIPLFAVSVQILETPCGHEANLWEKFIGGKSAERYLCFTKTEKVEWIPRILHVVCGVCKNNIY